MSDLGDVLELMHGAARSFRTVRLTAREWTDRWDVVERLWVELPDRVREERETDGRAAVLVLEGRRWWSWEQGIGAMTNDADLDHGHGLGGAAQLLEPASLLPAFDLRVAGHDVVAGRACLLVHGTRRTGLLTGQEAWSAAAVELAIDAERGVALRRAFDLDGDREAVTEILEIAFDEALPPRTFARDLPAGR